MNNVWSWIASMMYGYGVYSAGQASVHGSFEAEVPTGLQETQKDA